MKSLPTLIKLAHQRINNQRFRLLTFEKKRDEFEKTMTALKENLKFEAERATQEPLLSAKYGQYAQEIEGQVASIMKNYDVNQKRLIREQDRLSALFKEQKVLEVYQDQQHKKARKIQDIKAQKTIDEIALRLKRLAR